MMAARSSRIWNHGIVSILTLIGLGACTEPEDVYHLNSVSLGPPVAGGLAPVSGVAADAKQRFVWGPTVPIRQLKGVDSHGNEIFDIVQRQVVCAEPSPDALSTFSASVAAALRGEIFGQGGAGGEFSQSLSEAARILGQRTPTIQLLRDGFYRACEAYGNGLIDSFGYALILNKIDELMVELVAIDALGQGQLKSEDVSKIEDSAAAEEAAEVAQITFADAQRNNTQAQAAVENLRAQQRGLAGQISTLKAQQAEAQATADAATAAAAQLPDARTRAVELATQIASKEAEKVAQDRIANDPERPEADRAAASAASQRLAGELAGLRRQQQTADQNLHELEATAGRGDEARRQNAELTARLGPLETQKAAVDTDVGTAESTATAAQQTVANARTTFATEQAKAEGKRAALGTVRPELSSAAMTQILEIVRMSRSPDNGLSTIAGACALWFAQHPGITARVGAGGAFSFVASEVPAIALYCARALQAVVARPTQ